MTAPSSMGRSASAVWAFVWRELKVISRSPALLIAALARPCLWLLLLGYGLHATVRRTGGVDYRHYVFGGVLVLSVLLSGLSNGVSIVWERELGSLREALLAPVSRGAIAAGRVAAGAVVAVLHGVVVLAFAPLVSLPLSPGAALLAIAAVVPFAVACTALGLLLATAVPFLERAGSMVSLVAIPLYFLSGGFYPLEGLPGWMATLVRLNPATYAVDLVRHALEQAPRFSLGLDLAVVVGFAAVTSGLSTVYFRRQDA